VFQPFPDVAIAEAARTAETTAAFAIENMMIGKLKTRKGSGDQRVV
jgi:hypothetical protein